MYDTQNSDLPDNDVFSISIDQNGNKWIATYGGGVAFFDGSNWTIYNTSNSDLPSDAATCINIEANGKKWIGTYGGGLASFDGVNWEVYKSSNSDLPSNVIRTISIDAHGNKWIGTNGGGVAIFNDTSWTVHHIFNSGLPNNYIRSIEFENNGNAWIATHGGGLAVYKQGGVVSVEEFYQNNFRSPNDYFLQQNYPNPFNPSTTIKYTIPNVTLSGVEGSKVQLKVYDILGNEVANLVDEYKPAGSYEVDFNAANLASGIYFYKLQVIDPESSSGQGFVETKKMILLK